jgi:predicted ATP-grasp superfamily ATP-dependent carboligase
MAIVGDTQVGLWVVRSLGRNGLGVLAVVRSPEGQSAHSRYARGAWALSSPVDSPEFMDSLESLAKQWDVGSVMTISEGYHQALIAARDRFEPDIHVFSPPQEKFDKATDKDTMQQLCHELGVPVARGTTLDRLRTGQEELAYPLVLRTRRQNDPAAGRAPWKAAYAENPEQLDRLHGQVAEFADNVLVQEYHPGAEEHVQVLMHEGRAFMTGDYIGQAHMPLAGGVTVLRTSCHHPRVIRDAVAVLKALEWEGIAGVQFHTDPTTGEYIFLEINPRFIGGLPTVVMAGFEAPFLLWQSRFEPHRMKRTAYQVGLSTRILGGHANWMFGMMRGDQLPPGQKRLGTLSAAARFLWHSGPWTRDDCLALGDPKPFLADLRQMIRRLGAETFDIIGNPETQEGGT